MGCDQSTELAAVIPDPEPSDPFEAALQKISKLRVQLKDRIEARNDRMATVRFLLTSQLKLSTTIDELKESYEDESELTDALNNHIAKGDAIDLKEATDGIGADETKMGSVIVSRLPESIAMTNKIYEKSNGIDLETLVNKEGKSNLGWLLTGALSDFGKFMSYRVTPQPRRDALLLRKCMAGIGCDDPLLLEVLSTRTNDELRAAVDAYAEAFPGEDLRERIKSETGGMLKKNYGDWCDKLVEFNRDESDDVSDDAEIASIAEELYNAGAAKTFGCDEEVFLKHLNQANPKQIKAICKAYKEYGSLEEDIKKKMGGDLEYALLARVTPRLKFFARRIFSACKGWGTDEEAIARVLGCLDNSDVFKMIRIYEKIHSDEEPPFNNFAALMKSELSGDFLEAILMMVDGVSPKGHWKAYADYSEEADEAADEFKEVVKEGYDSEKASSKGKNELNGPLSLLGVKKEDIFLCDGLDDPMEPSSEWEPFELDESDKAALFESDPDDLETARALVDNLETHIASQKKAIQKEKGLEEALEPAMYKCARKMRRFDFLVDQLRKDNAAMTEFSAQRDADDVHEAVAGWGTDKDKLVDILCSLSKQQMLRVNEIYKEKYGETLRSMIDGELAGFFGSSSHFKYFMQLLLTPTDQVDAELLDDSMRGWGTDEALLTELCVTRTNAEIRAMKTRFLQMNGKPVSSWVTSETSSSYQRFLMYCLDGDRNEGHEDEEEAAEDAKKLYNAGLDGSDEPNEKKIFKIITRASVEQIGLIKKAYKNKYETDLITAICEVFDSDLEKAIVARCTKKHQYYANVLDNAWKGLGTDEQATSRVFARASKSDMKKIAKAYKKQTGNDFRSQIESETSGMYKQALIAYLYNESPSAE